MRKRGVPEKASQILSSIKGAVNHTSEKYREHLVKKGVLDNNNKLAKYLKVAEPEKLLEVLKDIKAEKEIE